MSFLPEKAGSRRDFFEAGGRYCLLGLLGVVAALSGRHSRLNRQRCVNQGICSSCGMFASCGLPQALSAKQTRGAR